MKTKNVILFPSTRRSTEKKDDAKKAMDAVASCKQFIEGTYNSVRPHASEVISGTSEMPLKQQAAVMYAMSGLISIRASEDFNGTPAEQLKRVLGTRLKINKIRARLNGEPEPTEESSEGSSNESEEGSNSSQE